MHDSIRDYDVSNNGLTNVLQTRVRSIAPGAKRRSRMAGENRSRKQVLVTGAEGVIGTAIRLRLSDRYDLRSLTRRPRDFPSYVADIADLDAILPAFEGIDAVVHLAASSAISSDWDNVLRSNIIGTYNVYEAARRAGAGAVVFASSNHAVGMYEVDGAPTIHEPK